LAVRTLPISLLAKKWISIFICSPLIAPTLFLRRDFHPGFPSVLRQPGRLSGKNHRLPPFFY
jgi:hypothetical protein